MALVNDRNVDTEEKKVLFDILKDLGLKQINANDILKNHIEPILMSNWDKKPYDRNIFMEYARFIRDYYNECSAEFKKQLPNCFPVLLKNTKNVLKRGIEHVYRSTELGNRTNLETIVNRTSL